MGGEAAIISVKVEETAAAVFSFSVTVSHADEGWEHYADAWRIYDREGNLLAERVLLHPHVDEQPFTRSLTGVSIPPEMCQVDVRAVDSIHGEGSATMWVDLCASPLSPPAK